MVCHRFDVSACVRPISGDRRMHFRNTRSTMQTRVCAGQLIRCRRRVADDSDRGQFWRCRKSCSSIHTSPPNWPQRIRGRSYACVDETVACKPYCKPDTLMSFRHFASHTCVRPATSCHRTIFHILHMPMVGAARCGCECGAPTGTTTNSFYRKSHRNAQTPFRVKTLRDCRIVLLPEMSARKWCRLLGVDFSSGIVDEINICR